MKNALIAPTEAGYSLLRIKRALLTYNKIYLLDPGDRDLFPGNAFMTAVGMPPVFSISMGPVRPLGKIEGYDEAFDRLADEVRQLQKEQILEIISTYNRSEISSDVIIGAVPMGGYPLDPKAMLFIYRSMASDAELLRSAIDQSALDYARDPATSERLTVSGLADASPMNGPVMPLIEGAFVSEELRSPLTVIARSRIAAAIKISGFCHLKEMVPVFQDRGFASVLAKIAETARTAIDQIDDDPYWVRKNVILDVAHDEFLDNKMLEEISLSEILKLRTSEWECYNQARSDLFTALAALSEEMALKDFDAFKDQVKKRILDYKKKVCNLETEREKLRFKIKCDIGLGFGAIALAHGAMSQISSPLSIPGTLVASAMWLLTKTKEHGPEIKNLCRENDMLRGANEFGLYDFFRRIGESRR